MTDHPLTEYGTTRCPVEGVAANVDDGECSACGAAVTGQQPTPEAIEWERRVTRRCPRMFAHGGESPEPVPCSDCYSIESIWRRIPYEPDSSRRTVGEWQEVPE